MASMTMWFISSRGRGSNINSLCLSSSNSSTTGTWVRGLTSAAIFSTSLKIINAGIGAQFFINPETPFTEGRLADPAVGVAQVAEYDCIGRAGLAAGRNHIAVYHGTPFSFSLILSAADALDTESAFLSHAAPA